jgi:hypothetical protein
MDNPYSDLPWRYYWWLHLGWEHVPEDNEVWEVGEYWGLPLWMYPDF